MSDEPESQTTTTLDRLAFLIALVGTLILILIGAATITIRRDLKRLEQRIESQGERR